MPAYAHFKIGGVELLTLSLEKEAEGLFFGFIDFHIENWLAKYAEFIGNHQQALRAPAQGNLCYLPVLAGCKQEQK